jgi:hypothetical protein
MEASHEPACSVVVRWPVDVRAGEHQAGKNPTEVIIRTYCCERLRGSTETGYVSLQIGQPGVQIVDGRDPDRVHLILE